MQAVGIKSAFHVSPQSQGLKANSWTSVRCSPPAHPKRFLSTRRALTVRAQRDSRGGGFWTGFVLGGAVFGALGFIFAPQISSAILGEDQKLKLPNFLDDEKDPEAAKRDLAEKIAQLNAAIDEVSSQLVADDTTSDNKTPQGALKERSRA